MCPRWRGRPVGHVGGVLGAEWKKPGHSESRNEVFLLIPDSMKPGSWGPLVPITPGSEDHLDLTPKAALRHKWIEGYAGLRHPKSGGSINAG